MFITLKKTISRIILVLSLPLLVIILFFKETFIELTSASTTYLFAILLVFLFFSTLIHNLKPEGVELMKSRMPSSWRLSYASIVTYVIALFASAILLGSRVLFLPVFCLGLFTLLVWALGLRVRSSLIVFSVSALFLTLVTSLYLFYPPSMGNDTWRDILWASCIDKGVNFSGNPAYFFPIIPILYLILSKVLGFSPAEASALVGLVYAQLIIILVFIIARTLCKHNIPALFMTTLLTISLSLVTIWSVWFIPQAYAVVFFLLILLFVFRNPKSGRSDFALTLIPVIALVLGHAAISIFTAFMLLTLWIGARFFSPWEDIKQQYIKSTLKLLVVILLAYITFTTLIEVIVTGSKNILYILMKFFLGGEPQRIGFVTFRGNPLSTALLSYSPIAICVVMAFISWLENDPKKGFTNTFIEVGFSFGGLSLAIALLGFIYNPYLVLERYIGFPAILLLTITSIRGFNTLINRGNAEKAFISALAIILILSVAYGETFNPDQNPFNVSNAFAVSAPVTWRDETSVKTLISHIGSGKAYADWRISSLIELQCTNTYVINSIISQNSPVEAVLVSQNFTQFTVVHLGGYDTRLALSEGGRLRVVCGNIAEDLRGVFLYRSHAFDELEIMRGLNEQTMYATLQNHDKVYSGSIEAFFIH